MLRRNGRGPLIDAFHGDRELADSFNRLLVASFYFIHIGYAALALRTADPEPTRSSAMELVCDKFGVVLIVLGAMHFFNLYIFNRNRLRKRGLAELGQPLPPGARTRLEA
jgi:hypothetical protein